MPRAFLCQHDKISKKEYDQGRELMRQRLEFLTRIMGIKSRGYSESCREELAADLLQIAQTSENYTAKSSMFAIKKRRQRVAPPRTAFPVLRII